MRQSPDYQHHVDAKLAAIPIPKLKGLSVLDVGCDHGYWSWASAAAGARRVLGIDRNRSVRGVGAVDLVKENQQYAYHAGLDNCEFQQFDIGKQWPALGRFDVVYLFSLYHHIYENCGDHQAIWHWLWRHTRGQLLWENPLSHTDAVVQMNVRPEYHKGYNRVDILNAAHLYFDSEYIGPAMHEETREVWRFTPKLVINQPIEAIVISGAGGATHAFNHEGGRRIKELAHILGHTCYPGSLNLRLTHAFDWTRGYYRAQVLDVKRRGVGLNTEWIPRWARIYPVRVSGQEAWAFRFEGEQYRDDFIELVAPVRLRDKIKGGTVKLCR